MYGISRLGIYKPAQPGITVARREYELTNHLGNVLATISDRKIPVYLGNNPANEIIYYTAEVLSQNDYYPGGMMMPGRKFNAAGSYRYGFNGKENDNEVKGDGNQIDYGWRVYDPRIGKFLSVDPLTKSYPMLTPYQYASNTPIQAIDKDGAEAELWSWRIAYWVIKAKLSNIGDNNITKQISEHNQAANNNYGRFDENRDIGEQVRENQKKTIESKAKVVGTFAKGAAISSAVVLTPYAIAAGGAVLPELFAIIGPKAESFLVQGTIKAFVNASAQQITSGKVDWADVALEYIPGKNKWVQLVKGAVEATVDYQDGKLRTIIDDKSAKETIVDALSIGFTNKIFGRFNKALEKAFEAKGLKGEKLISAMGAVIKSQTDFLKESIETALSEATKKKLKIE